MDEQENKKKREGLTLNRRNGRETQHVCEEEKLEGQGESNWVKSS